MASLDEMMSDHAATGRRPDMDPLRARPLTVMNGKLHENPFHTPPADVLRRASPAPRDPRGRNGLGTEEDRLAREAGFDEHFVKHALVGGAGRLERTWLER